MVSHVLMRTQHKQGKAKNLVQQSEASKETREKHELMVVDRSAWRTEQARKRKEKTGSWLGEEVEQHGRLMEN